MQIEVNRFNQKDEIRMSIEAYKEQFPLPNKLSDKNTIVDVWLDHEDDTRSIYSLVYLIAQSKAAVIVVNVGKLRVNGILTNKGLRLLGDFDDALNKYHYKRMMTANPDIDVWGMMHLGLVYTE